MRYIILSMAVEDQRAAEPLEPAVASPTRLVKTYLPVDLVRQMDVAIVRSAGGYLDRAEFITEAIRDRLAEQEASAWQALKAPAPVPPPVATADAERESSFADWLDAAPTLAPADGPGENFGLHNRDLPTLWALDWLGRLTARRGSPVAWSELLADLLPRAWEIGRALADHEPGGTSGFPTNLKRKEATEQRFAAHAVGQVSARANSGPLFVFRLVGLDGARGAPTPAAVELMRALVAAGFVVGAPFPAAAWEAFAAHLAAHAPTELEAWRSVLAIVADEPRRAELVARCTRWTGSTAATNAMSYVARGREWGLVEPALVDGRYRLTARGRDAATPPLASKRIES
jgi:Arc/MetJ-type ribon-helix-helix transcriptional regulator